jgi:hypothetical protein
MKKLILLLAASCIASPAMAEEMHMMSRNLKCGEYNGRASAICERISKEMKWSWMGHAIISPGFRVSPATLKNAWCEAHITADDIPNLKELAKARDWRLQQGAAGLLALLKTRPDAGKDGLPPEAYDPHNGEVVSTDENSAFNPKNPQYILKGGCSK